jgi:predicted aconitase
METIHIGKKELDDAYQKLNDTEDIQLIALGCPHLSVKEMRDIATFLKGKKKKNNGVEIWFCTSSKVREMCPDEVRIMEEFGPVLADTCMVVSPIEGVFERTGTNSAKAGNYLPTLCSQKVICRDISNRMEAVL